MKTQNSKTTLEDLKGAEYPIFLKHPEQWHFIKVGQGVIFSVRVELLDGGTGFEHKRRKKTFADLPAFHAALEKLVGYELVQDYDYVVALRDYFRKELEARGRYEPIYEQFMNEYRQRPEQLKF